jgi:hypothetical protein
MHSSVLALAKRSAACVEGLYIDTLITTLSAQTLFTVVLFGLFNFSAAFAQFVDSRMFSHSKLNHLKDENKKVQVRQIV